MGGLFSRMKLLFAREHFRLLFLGLDASGKTTVLYKLKLGKVVTTIPTIGFNVETISCSGIEITCWDVGGRDKMRALHRHYFPGTDAIVYVVDSNDRDRLEQSRDELATYMREDELWGLPIAVLCNKQDLPNAMSADEIREAWALFDKRLHYFPVAAVADEGLWEAFSELRTLMIKRRKEMPLVQVREEPKPLPSHAAEMQAAALGSAVRARFGPVQKNSACIFAKRAVLWGGLKAAAGATLEEQAASQARALEAFVAYSAQGKSVDGFVVELDDPTARDPATAVDDLGECVRRYLTALSDTDPAGEFNMRKKYVGEKGWRFRFAAANFFVTTFAPCYPETSSRYTHGVDGAFILLQPELSFERHGLAPDTPATQWKSPVTARDFIRVGFRKAGREYHIPATTKYPMAEHVVKPLQDDGTTVVAWWSNAASEATG